MLEFVEAESH